MAIWPLEQVLPTHQPYSHMLTALVTLSHQTSVEAPHDLPLFGKTHAQDRGIVLVPEPSASPNDPLNVSNPFPETLTTDQPVATMVIDPTKSKLGYS